MQKLKYNVLDKLILNNVTSAEIDFLLYVSRYQNDKGVSKGIYYRNMCKEIGISFQSFYDLKTSLTEKRIIKAEKNSYYDWDITILDNDCSDPESYQEGYINTNHNIFYSSDFYSMKAGAKLLAMEFMKISFSGRGCYNIGSSKFYDKYTKIFKVTKRVIQNYMQDLKSFFSIGLKEKQYWITPLAKVRRNIGSRTEASNYRSHIGDVICRRGKIKSVTKDALKDTVDLLKQYKASVNGEVEVLEELLVQAIKKSLEKANEGIRNTSKWIRELKPKLVHKYLIEQLKEYAF